MKKKTNEELYCHYSDLPSPVAYAQNCADYDSMGNHGRFPQVKKKRTHMKRIIQKLLLWLDLRKSSKKKKSVWDI